MKYSLLLLITSLSLIACNSNDEALNSLNDRNKAITTLAQERTAELRESEATINAMNDRITLVLQDLKTDDVPAEFQEKVKLLKERLEGSSIELKNLQGKLKTTSKQQQGLLESLSQLESDLIFQEQEMTAVLLELQEADVVISDQEEILVSLQIENGQLRKEMNQAYVAIGSTKELKAQGVIEKVGGLFGLGGKAVVSNEMNVNAFSEIDGSMPTSLTLEGQDVVLVTNHPATSYELIEFDDQSSLQIKDPSEFWSQSKYLAIALN